MTSLRLPDLARVARWLWLLAALLVGAVGAGWLIAHGHASYVAGGAAIAALAAAAFVYPAPLAALLLLVVLNGVPVIDLSKRLPGNLKVQDLAVFGLMALLIAYRDRSPSPERARIIRAATIWSACFIGWWVYEFARSGLLDGIPWLKAALYDRYYLYFAILLPLALRARFPTRSLRPAGILLIAGVVLCAIGQDVQSITKVSLSWLAHPAIVDQTEGLSRLYSSMALIVDTGLIFAVALLLSKEGRSHRWVASSLVVLFFVDAAVGLQRANYFALIVALLAGVAFYVAKYGSATIIVTRLVVGLAVVIVAVVAVNAFVGSSNIPVAHTVVSRANSGVSALVHATGTVGYREQLDHSLLHVLGGKWPVGLGFLHPTAGYIQGAPQGSIESADVGVVNILMTMGILGVVLIYAPLVYGLRKLLRGSEGVCHLSPSVPVWILCGGVAWIAWALAGSPTFDLLFSTPGLVLTALTLAGLAHLVTERNRTRHDGAT